MTQSIILDSYLVKELEDGPYSDEKNRFTYSCDMFEDQNMAELWKCTICQNVAVKDPVLVAPCGHHFCKEHIYKHFEDTGNKLCPKDQIQVATILDNLPQVTEMLKKLSVYCPKHTFDDAGCKWKGKLEGLNAHLKNDCQYAEILCKCGEGIARNKIALNECHGCKKIACKFCKTLLVERLLEAHEKSCAEVEITHKCGKKIKNKEIDIHENICHENFMECKYSIIGCKQKLHPKDLDIHYKFKEEFHFGLLQKFVSSKEQTFESPLPKTRIDNSSNDYKEHLPSSDNAKLMPFFLGYIKSLKNSILSKSQDIKPRQTSSTSEDLPSIGPYILNDGSIYIGQWKYGVQHGKGVSFFADGSMYEGFWSNGIPNDTGRFVREDGDIYEGDIENGIANGTGKFFHQSGRTYVGQFVSNEKNGYGFENWTDGSTYEGEFLKGERHGKGVYVTTNNKIYEGDFVNGKMQGKALYKLNDGSTYQGDFANNTIEGFGEYIWPDGRRYRGEWKHGKQHGDGIYMDEKGSIFEGEWDDGKVVYWAVNPNIKLEDTFEKDDNWNT